MTLDHSQLERLARRINPATPDDSTVREQLVWIETLARSLPATDWYVIEDAQSGMASYVEALLCRDSTAVALRKCIYAPYAAIGGASYSLSRPGELCAWTPLSLQTVENYDPTLENLVSMVRVKVRDSAVQLLGREELSVGVSSALSANICSSLPNIEGRMNFCIYDVLFQWDD